MSVDGANLLLVGGIQRQFCLVRPVDVWLGCQLLLDVGVPGSGLGNAGKMHPIGVAHVLNYNFNKFNKFSKFKNYIYKYF